MSLYRKKKRTGLKVFISFLFIISILIITAYYFFIPSSQINNLLNTDNSQEINIQQVEAKNKIKTLRPVRFFFIYNDIFAIKILIKY